MAAPWRSAAALAAGVALAACGSTTTATSPPTASVPTTAGATPAEQRAAALLASLPIPPGARAVAHLDNPYLDHAAGRPACHPLVDESHNWTVPGDPAEVVAYLLAHPPAGRTAGTGSLAVGGVVELLTVRDQSDHELEDGDLVLGVAASNGEVGVRADAQVIPTRADCLRSGAAQS